MLQMMIKQLNKLLFLIIFFSCSYESATINYFFENQKQDSANEVNSTIKQYENLLNSTTDNNLRDKILFQLADINLQLVGEYEKAAEHLLNISKTSDIKERRTEAYQKYAEINLQILKNYKISKDSYQSLFNEEKNLEKKKIYENFIIQSLMGLKNYKEVYKILKKRIEDDSGKSDYFSLKYLGLISYYQSNWSEAINYWNSYIKIISSEAEIVQMKFYIANCLEMEDRLSESYHLYYSILDKFPNKEIITKRLDAIYERRIARKR